MASGSNSSEDLHDIVWSDDEMAFNYTDTLSRSPQITAVLENNVQGLQVLLNSGKSINVNDNFGNTPLHVAVEKDKQNAFDFIVNHADVRIDVKNFDGVTPLNSALMLRHRVYYVRELLKKGANVKISTDYQFTSVHYAASFCPEVLLEIIKNGGDINAVNYKNETPLFIACNYGTIKSIPILLYYGADPYITDNRNLLPFDVLSNLDLHIQEVLFNYTFDEFIEEVRLRALKNLMVTQSQLFYKLINKNFELIYDLTEMRIFASHLKCMSFDMVLRFIEKFPDEAELIFETINPLKSFLESIIESKELCSINFDFLKFLYHFDNTEFLQNFVESYNCAYNNDLTLIDFECEHLTEFILCLVGNGFEIHSTDMDHFYKIYGLNDLFKILLHMKITLDPVSLTDIVDTCSIIPKLIYDINFEFNYKAICKTQFIQNKKKSLETVSPFFAIPAQFTCEFNIDSTNVFPSLVELAREATRKFLINKYQIKNNVEFFTMLKWLPTSEVYKKILSYEKAIY